MTDVMSPSVSAPAGRFASAGFWEIAGSVAWFAMEGAWLFELSFGLTGILIAITVAFNAAVFLFCERTLPVLAVTGAENCWVLLNVFWLIDDYHDIDWCLILAKALFVLGAALLVLAFLVSRGEAGSRALSRFRRLQTGLD